MPLVKKPGRKIWHYQVKLNGKTWCRSTGETSRRRVEVKAAELKRLADTLKKRPAGCLQLKRAIIEEVARVKIEVSESEGRRLDYCLLNFYKHVGRDIPLEKVDARMLDEYQIKRLQ